MDLEPFDSSGTDDDLPPSRQNRIPGGGRFAGSGRPAVVASALYPRMCSKTDMETEIHRIEQEAYSSILKAFKAQSDAITWEKESLLTELRKELRLSNEEHRELLSLVNTDGILQRIREWRQAGVLQAGHDPLTSPTVSVSNKKQKITQLVPHISFGRPSPPFHAQQRALSNQPSTSAPKRGPMMVTKGKTTKSAQTLTRVSSTNSMQYPHSGPTGRNLIANRVSSAGVPANEPVEVASYNPLVGRKVRTRWPADNNFYEALITEYNAVEGRHALVYGTGTANETWEWVKIAEMSPDDIQWEGEDPGIPHRANYGRGSATGTGRDRERPKGQSKKVFSPTKNDIRIRHTDSLIKEVEKVFVSSNPDPIESEKAKKVLKEHEQALIDVIGRLADISDGESDEGVHTLTH